MYRCTTRTFNIIYIILYVRIDMYTTHDCTRRRRERVKYTPRTYAYKYMVYTGRPIYHYHICIIYIIFIDDIADAAAAAGGHETAVSFPVRCCCCYPTSIIIHVADDRIHIYTHYTFALRPKVLCKCLQLWVYNIMRD